MSCLRSSSNVLVSIVLDYVSRKPLRRYQIIGDRGTLIWDLVQKQLLLQSSGQDEILCYNPNDFDMDKTYYSAMRELVCAIQQMSLPSQDWRMDFRLLHLPLILSNVMPESFTVATICARGALKVCPARTFGRYLVAHLSHTQSSRL